MMWKIDPAVEALRKRPGWRDFHRRCGDHQLFFDHIERDSKRAPYRVTAFTVEKRRTHYVNILIAEGAGKTPLEALTDAYRKANQPIADVEMDTLLGVAMDFEDILGGDAADELEDLLG